MTLKNTEIRQVIQNDALFLQQLMNNEQVMAILNEVPTSIDIWADAIDEWANDPDEEEYIILDEGMPIGWLGINGLSSVSKQVFIKIIALLPTHQGYGIGQYVMNDIMENLRLRGFTSLGLYTDCSNASAQHCYHKCGFEITQKIEQQMSNGTIVKRYKMERSL
jgi:ribosomal protein S18 acetylase RimI-like enzyme